MIDPAIAQFIESRLSAAMADLAARQATANEGRGGKFADALVQSLASRLHQLEQQLRAARSFWNDLQPRIFLIKKTGGAQWQEQTVIAGNIQDFEEGRLANSDADPSALIEPPSEVVAVMEIQDGDQMRCVRIGGGAERIGQYQYMLHGMVAQGVDGWDDARGAPER